MLSRKRCLLSVLLLLTVSLGMCVFVSLAPASRLSLSETAFRVLFRELVFDSMTPVACPVTLEGSFHSSSIAKISGALVGYVTRASVNGAACTGGTTSFETATLPWHVTYESFEGVLPRITRIRRRLINWSWREVKVVFGVRVTCSYRSSAAEPVIWTLTLESGGAVLHSEYSGTIRSSTFGCPADVMAGDGQGGRVTVVLI